MLSHTTVGQWRIEGAAAPGAGGGRAKMGIKTQEKAKGQVLLCGACQPAACTP
jgi:hypothetical protein